MSAKYEEEVEKCKRLIAESHEKATIIPQITNYRPYTEETDRILPFSHIYIDHLLPLSWFTDTYYAMDAYYLDVGRSIANGEKNHLIRRLLKEAETTPIRGNQFNISEVINTISDLTQRGYQDLKLFVPIEYYVKFHSSIRSHPPEKIAVHWKTPTREFLKLKNRISAQVFWSSKDVELKQVLLFSKDCGMWITKPGNVSDALTIETKIENRTNVDLLVKTMITYDIMDRGAIGILEFERAPPSPIKRKVKRAYHNYILRDGKRIVKYGITTNPNRRAVELENQGLKFTSMIIDPVALSGKTARQREKERIKAYQKSHKGRKPRHNK